MIDITHPDDSVDEILKVINTDSNPIFSEDFQVANLRKGLDKKQKPAMGRVYGRVEHPILMDNAIALMHAVNIQETCIRAKRDATVGLGFETEEEREARRMKRELAQRSHDIAMDPPPAQQKPVGKEGESETGSEVQISHAEEVLDPLCVDGFQSLLNQIGEDYENVGNAYIEVVRDEGGEIIALWHAPAATVYVYNERQAPHYHYEVDNPSPNTGDAATLKYACFGDLEGFRERNPEINQDQVTELIHFRMPTALSREYGMPSWLSCVPWLELAQKLMQYDFDYFDNRAVPDLMVLVTGSGMSKEDFTALNDKLKETVGPGKRHRTLTANISAPEAKIQVERLNADNRERLADQYTAVQLNVVSTHRVPPLLAGVTLPGKMAAANELPNALVAFQTLYVQQQQRNISGTLTRSLGNPEHSSLGLSRDDFHFKQITDYYDMGQMDTMSRMRETAIEATQNGRQLENGLKD